MTAVAATSEASSPSLRSVGLGGYLTSRRPISLVRDVVLDRDDVDEIVVVLGSLETDIAIAAPAIRSVRLGVVTLGVFGLAPSLRRAVESGRVVAHAYGVASIVRALQTGARAEPFGLTRAQPQAAVAVHALSGSDHAAGLAAVRPLRPTLGLVHVPYADPVSGTAWGYGAGVDLTLAIACQRLHVSYDVATDAPPALPNRFALPRHLIGELTHRPFGAFPSACWPLYGPYPPFYAAYAETRGRSPAPRSALVQNDAAFVRCGLRHDVGAILAFDGARTPAVRDHRQELERWLTRN